MPIRTSHGSDLLHGSIGSPIHGRLWSSADADPTAMVQLVDEAHGAIAAISSISVLKGVRVMDKNHAGVTAETSELYGASRGEGAGEACSPALVSKPVRDEEVGRPNLA